MEDIIILKLFGHYKRKNQRKDSLLKLNVLRIYLVYLKY